MIMLVKGLVNILNIQLYVLNLGHLETCTGLIQAYSKREQDRHHKMLPLRMKVDFRLNARKDYR